MIAKAWKELQKAMKKAFFFSFESTSPTGYERGELILGGHDIWSTQPLLALEVDNPSQGVAETSGSNDNGFESPMRGFLDHFGLSTEPSILIDADLEKLREKYFIPDSFQLITPSLSDWVTRPSKGLGIHWGRPWLNGNSNKSILPGDKEAFDGTHEVRSPTTSRPKKKKVGFYRPFTSKERKEKKKSLTPPRHLLKLCPLS
ncbi:hypothetical protein COCNU_scaffold009189G000010 [Cocos nucifera]|nr:hypothetical protein [Cocos nucifera]